MRTQFLSALWFAGVVVLSASAPLEAGVRDHRGAAATRSDLALETDCVADLELSGGSKALIRYMISCAVRDTDVRTSVAPGAEQELIRVSHRMSPKEPGARGSARCTLERGEMDCDVQRAGPVTFKGWLIVKPGTRCRDRFAISIDGTSHRLYPVGCPDAKRLPLPDIDEIEMFRQKHGLDLDLNGDSAAIEARAASLRQALGRGDPSALVARRTWGVPLRDIDLRELEYRLYYNTEGSNALWEWFGQNGSTFAGHWIDEAAGGLIYVRFTGDQDAHVAALRNAPGILAPERIVGYPAPALHSLAELRVLADLIVDEGWGSLGLQGLMTSVGIDSMENKVVVGACNPESVASVLIARFGSGAPFTVIYRLPFVAKTKEVVPPRGKVKPSNVRDTPRRLCGRP